MKRGFTLIELLAVIVILAIIALIAIPIVIHIIDDSKKSSEEQNLKLYIDSVEKAIARKQLEDSSFNPRECKIQQNGDLECFNETNSLGIVEVDMKGTLATYGIIYIDNNKFSYLNIILGEKKYYLPGNLIDDLDGDGKISIGDKYSYNVNGKDIYNFYVLSIEENKVNLIMDRNICEDETINPNETNDYCKYEWYSDSNTNTSNNYNKYGPVTAIQKLYNATKNWTIVDNINLNGNNAYQDESGRYGKIETTDNGIRITKSDGSQSALILYENNKKLKARLPKYSEVTSAGCTSNNNSCFSFLKLNLDDNIKGYWLLSASSGYNYFACTIASSGNISRRINYEKSVGIRPVITVPRSYLES